MEIETQFNAKKEIGWPKVTVLIPAYNTHKYINSAVNSALEQCYPNIEVLVVDDGSSPPLDKVIENIAHHDLRYHRIEHSGNPYPHIAGMKFATGKYIAILDSDDILTKDSIKKRAMALETDRKAGFCYGDIILIDKDGKQYGEQRYRDYKSIDNFIKSFFLSPIVPIKHSGVMFRKESVDAVGGYDKNFVSGHDNDLIIRIAKQYGMIHLHESVAYYRTHDTNTTNSAIRRLKGVKWKFEIIDREFTSPLERIKLKTAGVAISLAKASYSLLFSKRYPLIISMLKGQRD